MNHYSFFANWINVLPLHQQRSILHEAVRERENVKGADIYLPPPPPTFFQNVSHPCSGKRRFFSQNARVPQGWLFIVAWRMMCLVCSAGPSAGDAASWLFNCRGCCCHRNSTVLTSQCFKWSAVETKKLKPDHHPTPRRFARSCWPPALDTSWNMHETQKIKKIIIKQTPTHPHTHMLTPLCFGEKIMTWTGACACVYLMAALLKQHGMNFGLL